jgi:RNA polymerase sigma factor (sigma-70 family)
MSLPNDGSPHIFDQLYQSWWEQVRRTARAVLGSDDAAQDVAQRVFMRVWRSGAWKTMERPNEFFYRAAVNEALSAQRRQLRKHELNRQLARADLPMAPSPEHRLIRRERRARLENMIEKFPPRCAMVCRLVFLDELTHAEAARALGISSKAVEKQVARARRHLRALAEGMSTHQDTEGGGKGRFARLIG